MAERGWTAIYKVECHSEIARSGLAALAYAGPLHIVSGLPPNIKQLVNSIVEANPTIKCKYRRATFLDDWTHPRVILGYCGARPEGREGEKRSDEPHRS